MSRSLPVVFLLVAACSAPALTEPARSATDASAFFAGDYRGEEQDRAQAGLLSPTAPGRQVVRTGQIGLVVDDWEAFRPLLDAQLATDGGFVGDASLSHVEGEVSYANLTVRVPVDKFDAFVEWAQQSGEVTAVEAHSADVTRDWTDLQARIENGQREAATLRDLLDNRAGSLEDVLAVERELARVQGEVDQAQRDALAMHEQVALSTIGLSVQVRAHYTPPVQASFGSEIRATFADSVDAMVAVGKGSVLAGVAAVPWLAALAAAGAVAISGIKALITRMARR
jgi:hypothetical protein